MAQQVKRQIQSLQDSELIRLFLDFVQTYQFQYQKIIKEISYKCYEAVWILATVKGTGYGRTQSEAYKHALVNLLELLADDPSFTLFFSCLGGFSVPPKKRLRTEGEQNLNKESKVANRKRLQSHQSIYSQTHQMSTKKHPLQTACNNKKQALNRQQHNKLGTQEASLRVQELEEKLAALTRQNQLLRERIEINEQQKQQIVPKSSGSGRGSLQHRECGFRPKMLIPKLKLEILPNYHKHSQKSLNDSLMAAYQSKKSKNAKLA